MATKRRDGFQQVLTDAINDLLTYGFDSQERLTRWTQRLEQAARMSLVPEAVLERSLRDMLLRTYERTVDGDRLIQRHQGISQYTLAHIKPKLRSELDRRILASSSLIRLNREQAIQQTLQRFAGWATSIPIGGTEVTQLQETKDDVKRGLAGLQFRERRVIIDQNFKLISSIDNIVAVDSGAIAAVWKHVREGGGYQARPLHEKRNDHVFVIRDNWALQKGLMRLAGRQYTDQIEAPGELVYCRCWYSYVWNLRSLPSDMLTRKGEESLIDARVRIAQMGA